MTWTDALKEDLDAMGLMVIQKPNPKDKSCIGPGATHNACACFLDRMAKLEEVARCAEVYLDKHAHPERECCKEEVALHESLRTMPPDGGAE